MSTRATYEFKTKTFDGRTRSITCYIHYDGYLSGAAAYLYDMLLHDNRRGGAVERFLRANPLAEITTCHSDHGDTDYRYTITCENGQLENATVFVQKRHWDTKGDSVFEGLGTYRLRDFIAKHTDLIEGFTPFQDVEFSYRSAVLNQATADQYLNAEHGPLHHLRAWSKSKPFGEQTTNSANWQNQVRDLQAVVDAFPELETEEIRGYLATAPAVV